MDKRYQYRSDGNFFIQVECEKCECKFDVHAMASATADTSRFCPACIQVAEWERESQNQC